MFLETTDMPQLMELPHVEIEALMNSARMTAEKRMKEREQENEKEYSLLDEVDRSTKSVEEIAALTGKITSATKTHTKRISKITEQLTQSKDKPNAQKKAVSFEREAAQVQLELAKIIQETLAEMVTKIEELKGYLTSILHFVEANPPGIDKYLHSVNTSIEGATLMVSASTRFQESAIGIINKARTKTLKRTSKQLAQALQNYSNIIIDMRDNIFKPIVGTKIITLTLIDPSEERLTAINLFSKLSPFLFAIEHLQQKFDELQGREPQQVIVRKIKHNSPIQVSLEGGKDAVEAVRDLVEPKRRQIKEEDAKASIIEKRARAYKERSEAKKLEAEAESLAFAKTPEFIRLKIEQQELENEKLRIEVMEKKLEVFQNHADWIADFIEKKNPHLTQEEKTKYILELLPSITQLLESPLEVVNLKRGIDA